MTMITGIKNVDFKVYASGHGVINWNGITTVSNNEGTEVNNHKMPKLRGYTNRSGRVKEDSGYEYKKNPRDVNLDETPMYVSANCIRHHLFVENTFDVHFANKTNQTQILASNIGLLRGYLIPSLASKRASPFFLTDFMETTGNGNFEQMGRAGSKKDENGGSTYFSQVSFGETRYEAYGSINIEQLSFISLDDKFGRAAISGLTTRQIPSVLEAISNHIHALAPEKAFTEPVAQFHENFVRKGTIFDQGEAGIALSQEAIDVLVDVLLYKLRYLSIKQGGGYLVTDHLEVDYNDSPQMMRIRRENITLNPEKKGTYAVYFEPKERP